MKNKLLSRAGDRRNHKLLTGFTALELLIAVTIITLTSTMVLISFTGVHEWTAVNRAARELALAARRVQNIALSVTEVEAGFTPTTAQTVGLHIVSGSSNYTLFLDKNEDGVYGAGDVVIGDVMTFTGGIRIRGITYIDSTNMQQTTLLAHMIAVAPEATLKITNASGGTLGETLQIEIGPPVGDAVRTITVRTSGQISIK